MPQTTPYAGKFSPNPYTTTSGSPHPYSNSSGSPHPYSSSSNSSGSPHPHHYTPGPVETVYGGLCYHDNSLVSGSLEALIQHLVPTVDYFPDRSYIFTFLLSSRLFLHPYELMSRVCYMCLEQHRTMDPQIDRRRIREIAPKIVQLLTEWTETFPYDFRDERMMRSIKDLTHRLALGDELSRRAMQRVTQRLLRKLTTLGQYEESLVAAGNAPVEKLTAQKAKQQAARREDVMSMCSDPFVLAQQLTHIEMLFFNKRRASNLEAYVDWFNRLSYLVATEICTPVKKKQRARILEFFIDVARECFNIGNFNSLMAIITGMNMSPVSRLKKTWSKVDTAKFDILEHQMDPTSNFYNYRTALRGATQRCLTAQTSREKIVIPFFSLFIKDIYFLNEGCVSRLPNGQVNFEKFWELAKQVSEFLSWRLSACPFERERKTLQYLLSTPVFSDDELQLASYESEGPENNIERDTRRSLRSSLYRA
ncbi:ras-GEF domain-containing family member 1B-B isoform X2 [Engraulis encrasicolus]|uniref:ras-GEF domain-containing family member 1B-B isoform X2 n=1 Tax=Engraulis encrasicolus TaxID=184585 RepID=UPI002FD05337